MKSRVSDQKREVRNVEPQSKILIQTGTSHQGVVNYTPMTSEIPSRRLSSESRTCACAKHPRCLSPKLETSRSLPELTVDRLLIGLLI